MKACPKYRHFHIDCEVIRSPKFNKIRLLCTHFPGLASNVRILCTIRLIVSEIGRDPKRPHPISPKLNMLRSIPKPDAGLREALKTRPGSVTLHLTNTGVPKTKRSGTHPKKTLGSHLSSPSAVNDYDPSAPCRYVCTYR